MILLIDATNIIAGGGTSHLIELLKATNSLMLNSNNIKKIIVVGVPNVTEKLPTSSWLHVINIPENKLTLSNRIIWKLLNFNKIIKQHSVDFIFNPGGSYFGTKTPFVTMCRNMLVFETREANRFGYSLKRLKFIILRYTQALSMTRAKGVIFISKYAQQYVEEHYPKIKIKDFSIVSHGIAVRFKNEPKHQKEIERYSVANPFKILYVSILDVYKHHDKVAEAIVKLVEKENLPLEFVVVGKKAGGYKEFEKIRVANPQIIKYLGEVPFSQIQNQYKAADLFIIGSTCENMPNILIEAMSSGIPVVSSDKQPMPEFLGLGGRYFSVENIDSIFQTLNEVIRSVSLRQNLLEESTLLSRQYSWAKCAQETFEFIKKCYYKS